MTQQKDIKATRFIQRWHTPFARVVGAVTLGSIGYGLSYLTKGENFQIMHGIPTAPPQHHIAQTAFWAFVGATSPLIGSVMIMPFVGGYAMYRGMKEYEEWKQQLAKEYVKMYKTTNLLQDDLNKIVPRK